MKQYTLETNIELGRVSNEQLVAMLKESYIYCDSLYRLYNLLKDDKKGLKIEAEENGEDDSEYLLELLSDIKDLDKPENLNNFVARAAALTPALGRRVATAVMYLSDIFNKAHIVDTYWAPLKPNEENVLKCDIYECIGNLATFIVYQYDLLDVVESIKNKDIVVPAPVATYVDAVNHGITPENLEAFANMFIQIMSNCKPIMPFFDKYPELLESFLEMAGPYASDFEQFSDDLLTLTNVNDVINGERSAGEIVDTYLEKKRNSIG